jgi:hypothetical protein
MRKSRTLPLVAAVLVIGACGGRAPGSTTGASPPQLPGASPAIDPAAPSPATVAAATSNAGGLAGRTRELMNPDASAMVFLYHDLAGLTPPLEQWVEYDDRVTFAPGPEKAARREQVRAELLAGLQAVRDIGLIRLTLTDRLSEYDPVYEEFSLASLAPSSSVPFKALRQEVGLRFGNGRDAQIWAVPRAASRTVLDSLGHGRGVTVDVLAKITAVQPSPRGGSIVADVIEYEIRTEQGNRLLARVRPAPQ